MRLARIVLTAALLAAAPAALAGSSDRPDGPKPPAGEPLSRLDEALDHALADLKDALHRLDRLLGEVPRYALPEITENGDIIIRRRPPQNEPGPPPRPEEHEPEDTIEL